MGRDSKATARRAAALAGVLAAATTIWGCETTPKPKHPHGALIVSPATCQDFTFPIYFEPRSSKVTHEADQLFAAAQDRSRGCDVTGIVVIGLADSVGAPDANQALSKARAEAVMKSLHRHGFNTVEFQVAALGSTGAINAAGDNKPLRRRADVSVHLMDHKTPPIR